MKLSYCLFFAVLVSIASADYWQVYKNYADSSCTSAQYQGVVVMTAGACSAKACSKDSAGLYYTTECVDTSVGPVGASVPAGFAALTTFTGTTTCGSSNIQVIAKSGACLQAGGVQFKMIAACGAQDSITRQFYAQDFTCANAAISSVVVPVASLNKCTVISSVPVNATCVPVATPTAPVAAPVKAPSSAPVTATPVKAPTAATPVKAPVAAPVKKSSAVALGVNVMALLLVIVAAIQF